MWDDISLWFDLHFLMISNFEHSFMCPMALCIFLEKYPFRSSAHVLSGWFYLTCMSCLYILYINLLWVMSLTNIFSHSVGSLFVFSMILFAVQIKFLTLIVSNLSIFVFISFAWKDINIVTVWSCNMRQGCWRIHLTQARVGARAISGNQSGTCAFSIHFLCPAFVASKHLCTPH